MRRIYLVLAALAAGSSTVIAQDAAEPASPLTGYIDNYAAFDATGPGLTTYHELGLTLEGAVSDDLTLGADATFSISTDLFAPRFSLDDPSFVLRATSVVAGTFEILDAGTALSQACVTPIGGSSNFGTEPLSFGTCTGYGGGQSFLYSSPEQGGVTVYLSAMADPWNDIGAGEIDTSISAAVGYSGEAGAGTISVSLGIDKALTLKGGGGPLPTLLQSGVQYEIDGWTIGTAGQLELASLGGGNSWATGAGIGREVAEGLTLKAAVGANGYEDAGTPTNEYSVAATAEYALIADTLYVDAGVSALRTIGSTDTTTYSAGTGLYLTHSF